MHGVHRRSSTDECRTRGISILTSFLLLLLVPMGAPAQNMACTDCHNPSGIPAPHNAGCSNTSCLQSCHAIDLNQIAHLSGAGTPLTADRTTTCNNCHNPPFEGIYHPYKINVLAGSLTLAGVIDLNQACGQCHGGGTQQVSSTGNITSGSSVLTVASSTGFTTGSNIRVTGAGTSGDLDTSIASVPDGTTINLLGAAGSTVSGAAVLQSPTKNGALYRTKAILATVAKGMHNAASVTYPVTFSTAVGSGANSLQVTVAASVGCTTGCPPFTYDWDWGDGTAHDTTSGAVANHIYASANTYSITLTVNTSGKVVGSVTRNVTVTAPDLPPTASGTCTWNANTWTVSVTDTSTDTDATGVMNATVTWGDGGSSTGAGGATLTHTYLSTGGPYTLTLKAIDSALQASSTITLACSPTPATFTISGTVKNRAGTAAVSSAAVTVKKGTSAVAVKYTASDGTFSAGGLKPGTYTLTVAKVGYTFASPAATITVGPSSSGNTINATAP